MSDNLNAGADGADSGLGSGEDFVDPLQSMYDHVAIASKVGSILSIVLCSFVLITYGLIRKYQSQSANRVSLRLAIAGTSCDFFYAVALLISAEVTGPGPLCNWSMFFQVMFLMMSLFTTAAIGLNLLLVFVLKVRATRNFERAYYVVSALIAIILPLVCLTLGKFGWDGTECWYTYDEEEDASYQDAFTWEWVTYYAWVIAVILFCSICTILFYWTVRRSQVALQHPTESQPTTSPNGTHANTAFAQTIILVRQAVDRIKWYCIVPLIAYFFSLYTDMEYFITNYNHEAPWILANFLSGAHGALNAGVFFFFDPSVRQARNKLRLAIVYRYYLRFHSLDVPPTSPMSTVSSTGALMSLPISPSATTSYPNFSYPNVSELKSKPALKLRQAPKSKAMFSLARFLTRQADIDRFVMSQWQKSRADVRKPMSRPLESQTSGVSIGTDVAVDQLDSMGGSLGRDVTEAMELL